MPDITENLCSKLRDTVNSSNIFYMDEQEKQNFNVLCATMDRVDDSISYILTHKNLPQTNNDFLLFMVHACIIRDAICRVMLKLGMDFKKYQTNTYFHDILCSEPLNLSEEQIKNVYDGKFFEYIRSLAFAHPLYTTQASFLKKGEEQCSPFIMIDRGMCKKGCVGIHVYSNKSEMPFTLQIPYNNLFNYVIYQYSLIEHIDNELKQRISKKEEIWQQTKINREQSPEQILQDIKSILQERFISTYDIDAMISLLTCKYTCAANEENIKIVQAELIKLIPVLCDAIDAMDYEKAYEVYEYILYARPKYMHNGADYELEKIFCCLNDDSSIGDQIYGKMIAKHFIEGFAKKWVVMNLDTMSFEEFHMLTRIACFLEKQEQDKNEVQL